MLSKLTPQNGRILSLKNTNKSIWKKTYSRLKNDLINLKLDPQNIELKEPIKNIGSFEVKIHIHRSPNAGNF